MKLTKFVADTLKIDEKTALAVIDNTELDWSEASYPQIAKAVKQTFAAMGPKFYTVTLDTCDKDDPDFKKFLRANDIQITAVEQTATYESVTFEAESKSALSLLILTWYRSGDPATDDEMLESIEVKK